MLHEGREKGTNAGSLKALGFGALASGALMVLTSFLKLFPDTWLFPGMQDMRIGLNWSLLSFGSGLLVGFRICLSMAIGTFISWFLLPLIPSVTRNDPGADIPSNIALGHVARDGIDGRWRPYFTRAEMEPDSQVFSRS